MNKEAILIIGCMERYRFYKQLSGHEVAELFAHCIIRDLDNYINIHTG